MTVAGKLLCEGHTTSCEDHNCSGTFCTPEACGYTDHAQGIVHGCFPTCSIDGCTQVAPSTNTCSECDSVFCGDHIFQCGDCGVTLCGPCLSKHSHGSHENNNKCSVDGCTANGDQWATCTNCGRLYCPEHWVGDTSYCYECDTKLCSQCRDSHICNKS